MLPAKVKVAGVTYDVVEVPMVQIYDDKNYSGACHYDKTKIEILEDMSECRKEQVFVHELVHAVFNEAGFDEHDEDLVNRLGIVLYQVLKDNDLRFKKLSKQPSES